ncbi:MAG: energy transducer TonB [Cytophagaceae bacterium]
MENVLKESFNELVFENRNKNFGAYSLRQRYSKHVLLALAGSAMAFTLALASPVVYDKYFKAEEVQAEEEKVVARVMDLNDVPKPKELPPPPLDIPDIASIKFPPLEIKPDDQVLKEEEVATVDKLKESTPGEETKDGDKGITALEQAVEQVKPEEVKPQEEEIAIWVDQEAEFPGGQEQLVSYIQGNLHYTADAKAANIQGLVVLEFTVNKDGSLTDFKVLKSLGHGLDEEAMRVVKSMPKWKPGYLNGEPKKIRKKMKFPFSLK